MKLAVVLLATALGLVPAARAATWARPVQGPVLRPFALSADRFARGQHRGIDIGAAPGTVVRAACGGRVRFAGTVPGGGRTVTVGCGRLLATYQHLGVVAVRRGQVVGRGAPLGNAGRSGRPREPRPHVHLGARVAGSGRYIDPLTLLGERPPAPPPLPLGPAPRPLPPGPEPRPLSPEPGPRPGLERPALALPAPPALGPAGDKPLDVAPRSPAVLWIGLVACALGLPLGGLLRRQRRPRSPAADAARARGWAPAHR